MFVYSIVANLLPLLLALQSSPLSRRPLPRCLHGNSRDGGWRIRKVYTDERAGHRQQQEQQQQQQGPPVRLGLPPPQQREQDVVVSKKSSPSSSTASSSSRSPSNIKDLSHQFCQLYAELLRAGPRAHYVTPTLRFSHVSSAGSDPTTQQQGEAAASKSKPIAVYIPGLDGVGITTAARQFDDLATVFELWRLTILPQDRSSFPEVVQAITQFVTRISHDSNGSGRRCRRVVLIGDSSGSLFAMAVARHFQQRSFRTHGSSSPVKGMVLVSPMTGLEQPWGRLVQPFLPMIKDGSTPYSLFGTLILAGLVPERIAKFILDIPLTGSPVSQIRAQRRDIQEAFRELGQVTGEYLPPSLVEHRLKWIQIGSSVMKPSVRNIDVPTLVVYGDEDRLLYASKQSERLVKAMPSCETLLVEGRGHFVLDETNLTEAIVYSSIDPLHWKQTKKRPYDPVTDWTRPSAQQIEKLSNEAKFQEVFHSPVFISTDTKGKRWMGLSKVVRQGGRPLVIVGNHQFGALDLRMVLATLIRERGIYSRGLGHPSIFKKGELALYGRIPGLATVENKLAMTKEDQYEEMQRFGVVPVTPRNYYRLLETGQDCCLFPSGSREALTGRKDYPLFWQDEKADFVRTAAKFNATIVPLSSIGMVDGLHSVLEPEQVVQVPLLGKLIRKQHANVTAARYDSKNESLVPAFVLPGVPQRNYFLFGKPYSLQDIDPRNKQACERIYQEVKRTVRQGLDELVEARENDPYKDTVRRLAYERLAGHKAPTFRIDEMNR